ncbi:MAG: (d)CMP kinase [candidate division KSB1 bacterium]|nr:(d)CMP kinase [candidate division KSB1 bacterium]
MRKNKIIAIDGPAGSGKSTTAKLVAKRLGFTYLDTGALYRALTLLALRNRIDLEAEGELVNLLKNSEFQLQTHSDQSRIWINGEEATGAIRSPEVSRSVSIVARHPAVRREMVQLQRRLASQADVVVEGRDIGTVVFPDADLKIFLTASLDARAQRRLKELREKGIDIALDELKVDIQRRDQIDSQRETAPLKKADDAIEIDTTRLTIEQQVDRILQAFRAVVQKQDENPRIRPG